MITLMQPSFVFRWFAPSSWSAPWRKSTRSEYVRALDGKLSFGAASSYSNRFSSLNVSVLGGLVSRREDVGQKQDLFVGEAAFDFDGPNVRIRTLPAHQYVPPQNKPIEHKLQEIGEYSIKESLYIL
jgi:hypothetical protein